MRALLSMLLLARVVTVLRLLGKSRRAGTR